MNPSKLGIAALAFVILGIATFAFLNRGYGKVSQDAYEVATALYSTCLAKSEDRLASVEEILNGESEKKIEISDQEWKWLQSIVSDARSGKWDTAAKSARQMMEDQVEQ